MVAAAAVVVSVLLMPPAYTRTTAYDLQTDADVEITGAEFVAEAGDVNGDGRPDVVVSTNDQPERRGRTWVVFGHAGLTDIDLAALGDGGFVIEGAQEDDFAHQSAGAGDVNGDGLDDVIVGAPGANRAYVVFGKASTEPVYLSDFDQGTQGAQGYRIEGPFLTGEAVDAAGDVNGDGVGDVIVHAAFGPTYVVFGKADTDPVDLADFDDGTHGDRGYLIRTPSPYASDLSDAASAGDVNGDGIPDVVIGVVRNIESTGQAFVVFGKTGPEPIDTRDGLDGEGFKIKGAKDRSTTGYDVDGAGDVDGDGKHDVIVGAPFQYCCGRGNAFVVFGKRNSDIVKLADLGDHGYKIKGEITTETRGGDSTGEAVSGAGDLDGDGRADVIVGAPRASHHHRLGSGSAFVVYGKRSTRTIRLADMGRHGYRIDGPGGEVENAGGFVAGPGDVDGDGRRDVLVGTFVGSLVSYLQWGR